MTLDDTEAENLRLKAALEGQNYLLNSYELLETVLSNVGVHIYMKAADGRYLFKNAAQADVEHIGTCLGRLLSTLWSP